MFFQKDFNNDLAKYPFVEIKTISEYSLLYKITGTDKSLKPYLLAAHYDVVPVVEAEWSQDPFSGVIVNNEIYGRGTLDCKGSMLAQLESVVVYLKKFGQPKRSIYLAYGHDEEITGYNGASHLAKAINEPLEYVIDEGTMIVDEFLPNFDRPIAGISIAEKGYLTVKFSVDIIGGHSSMPIPDKSATFIIAEAIAK
jgi:carboxypeptidase PM20D1